MIKKEKISVFVPALALEFPGNKEYCNLLDKIRWALVRLHLRKDFFSKLQAGDRIPGVFVEKIKFNKTDLGYNVSALLKSV